MITLTAGLFAAMLSSSGVALQAHVGQAALEQKQFEGQRAAMELKYFISQASAVRISEDGLGGLTEYDLTDGYAGTELELTLLSGSKVYFKFTPDAAKTETYSTIRCAVGSLSTYVDSGPAYTYSSEVWIPCESSTTRPFTIGQNGRIIYFWGLPGYGTDFGVLDGSSAVLATRPPLNMMGGISTINF